MSHIIFWCIMAAGLVLEIYYHGYHGSNQRSSKYDDWIKHTCGDKSFMLITNWGVKTQHTHFLNIFIYVDIYALFGGTNWTQSLFINVMNTLHVNGETSKILWKFPWKNVLTKIKCLKCLISPGGTVGRNKIPIFSQNTKCFANPFLFLLTSTDADHTSRRWWCISA